ncbi:hypothetical protein MRX96_037454 [Rhipicephalus microplus]
MMANSWEQVVQGGSLHVFLTKLPTLGCSLGHRFAYLTSLTEVTVDSVTEPELHMTLKDWTIINRYKHSSGIRQLHLDPSNARLVALDDRSVGHPLLLHNGSLTCQTQSGKTALLLVTGTEDKGRNSERELLTECLKLRRFNTAWQVCQRIDSKKEWTEFGNSALFNLDLDLAIRIFRQIGDVGMVWSLRELCEIEDKSLLAAYLAMFKGDFGVAQELFLASSQPTAALQMRRDLLHWEQALQLAKRLAQQEIPFISREYAQQLELANDNASALTYYETGITNDPQHIDHDKACRAGLARTSLRCGDIRKGVRVAKELNSRTLLRECAEILESMKQNQEAAPLYEQGNYYDKAANLYIKLKNWNKGW